MESFAELLKRKKKAEEGANAGQLASACKSLGDFYTQTGDFNKALKEFKQEADIYHQQKNQLKYAIANRWIGEAYLGLEDFDNALKHVEMYMSEYNIILKISFN